MKKSKRSQSATKAAAELLKNTSPDSSPKLSEIKPEQSTIELGPTASLVYTTGFIHHTVASQLAELWIDSLDWVQSEISLFGKRVRIPRLNAWYGDQAYAYSGTHFEAKPWTPELLSLKQQVEDASKLSFNSVLINYYRSGQDCMGWHSDDEAILGTHPQIASVSLGDNRRFVLRDKKDHKNKHEISLATGSLLLMLGQTQELWQHSLPRTTKSDRPRINLTFREIL